MKGHTITAAVDIGIPIDAKVQVAFPESPIIVNDDNYHAYFALIEKRLGLAHNKLTEIEMKAQETKKQLEQKIQHAKKECVEQIEANLVALQAKLATHAHPVLDENNSQSHSYINWQIKNLKGMYGTTRTQLFALSNEHADTIRYIDNIPHQLKALLHSSYQYGNGIDIIPYLKECLIIALYNAALEYRAMLLKDLNEKDIVNKIKAKQEDFNKRFDGIADLNDLLQITPIDQAREKLRQLFLPSLETFIHNLLQTSDGRKVLNAFATQLILHHLQKAKAYVENSLGFNPFDVQQKTITKWSTAYFRFTVDMNDCETRAEATKLAFSQTNEIASYDDFLDHIHMENADKFIENAIKKDLMRIKELSSQFILNVNSFQRLISYEHTFEQLIKPIEKNRTSSDIMLNAITKKCSDSHSSLINKKDVHDLGEQAKSHLLQKISDIQKQTGDLSIHLDKNTYDFDKLKRIFQATVQPLLESLLQKPYEAHSLDDEMGIADILKNIERISLEIEKTRDQLATFKMEAEYNEKLICIANELKIMINDATKFVQASYTTRVKLTISDLQIHANEFYTMNIAQVNKMKEQIKQYQSSFNQTMLDVEKAIEKDCENKIDQLCQYEVLIQQKQKIYTVALVCHLIVNAILNCYQQDDPSQNPVHANLDKQGWRRLMTKHNVQNQCKDDHPLLDVVLDDAHRSWCEDDEKAQNLLMALQCHAKTQSVNHLNMPIAKLYTVLRDLSIAHISHQSICELSAELISFNCLANLRVYWMEQDTLDQLQSGLASKKNIDDIHAQSRATVFSAGNTVLKPPSQDPESVPTTYLTPKPKPPGFFRRHWGKILFGLIVATIVVSSIVTAGLVPAIAAGVLSIVAPTVVVGPILAALLGVSGVAVASTLLGVGMAGVGKKLMVSREGGATGFFKRNWGKIGLACVFGGIAAATLFTLGGSLLIGTLAIGVVASMAAMGVTVSTTIAGGIGAGTVGAGCAVAGVVTGLVMGMMADCCVRCKKNPPHMTSVFIEEKNREDTDDEDREEQKFSRKARHRPTAFSSQQSTDCYLKEQFGNTRLPTHSISVDRAGLDTDNAKSPETKKTKKQARVVEIKPATHHANDYQGAIKNSAAKRPSFS